MNSFWVVLQNASSKRVFVECNSLKQSYYSYNDDRMTLYFTGATPNYLREGAHLLTGALVELPNDMNNDDMIWKPENTNEVRKYLGIAEG